MRHKKLLLLATALLLAALLAPFQPAATADQSAIDQARASILDGVADLANPSGPGRMVVYGEQAFSIANFPGQDHREPLIAGAFMGNGRVIALGDHQFLNAHSFGHEGSNTFYRNGLRWLAGDDATAQSLLDVQIVLAAPQRSESWFADEGFTSVTRIGTKDSAGVTRTYASELPLVYDAEQNPVLERPAILYGWNGTTVSEEDITLIQDFVKAGGGLFISDYGIGYQWWWHTPTPQIPGNKILREAGIAFTTDWPGGDVTPRPATGHMTLTQALDTITNAQAYSLADLQIASVILRRVATVLPADDPFFTARDAAHEAMDYSLMPTVGDPVSDTAGQHELTNESDYLRSLDPSRVTKHRLADLQYGAVRDDAPRIAEATATVDTTVHRWHATGMFVPPGEVVTVVVPDELVGRDYRLRVNAHTDNISRRDDWERMPVVHRSFDIATNTVEVANAFGGLLFVDIGDNPVDVGTVEVTIKDAVEAPYFVLGEHTDAEWNESLRARPAPFAVLVSPNMMISIPSNYIESVDLTEPTRLMQWWSDVVALQDDLTGQERSYPELANTDVQISAGAAHSGYPYQAYAKHWGNMADVEKLTTKGSWGDFHELGHNHQRGWWTFKDDGEVSVNIMSNISLEQMVSDPDAFRGWGYSTDPALTLARAKKDVAPGGTYSSKHSRWSFWFQLADGFGWDAYRNVFHQYEEDNRTNQSLLPTTDAEEKSQWLVRFSTEVGRDMSPFMVDTWGLQVSQSALDAVAHLPAWMPGTAAPMQVETTDGASVTFDPATSVTGTMVDPTITVSSPTGGTLTPVAEGGWHYDPAPAYLERETLTYELSSHGKVFATSTITVINKGAAPDVLPVGPARLLDTRPGMVTADHHFEANGALVAGSTLELDIAGRVGVPTQGVKAVVLNLAAVQPAAGGWVTAYPCGTKPNASSLNYAAGSVIANEIIAELSPAGTVCLFSSAATDLVVDATGYVPARASFEPITPARLLETRLGFTTSDGNFQGRGTIVAGTTIEVGIAGRAGVPATGAQAVVLNIAAVQPAAAGWITAYPCGTKPNASSLNYASGEVIANEVVAQLSANGTVCLFSSATTDLVVDATGYVPAGSTYTPVAPKRILETRSGFSTADGDFQGEGAMVAGSTIELTVAGRVGVPVSGAQAVVLNVAAVHPAGAGWITAYPCDAKPNASSLNYEAGEVIANEIIAELSPAGTICLFSSASTHLVVDTTGYLAELSQ